MKYFSWCLIAVGVAVGFLFTAAAYRAGTFGFHFDSILWPLFHSELVEIPFLILLWFLPILIGVKLLKKSLRASILRITAFCVLPILMSEAWYGVQDASIVMEARDYEGIVVYQDRYWPAMFGEQVIYSVGEGGYVTD